MSASQAQAEANARNAREHATGPRSDEGKAESCRNSRTRDGVSGSGDSFNDAERRLVNEFMRAIAQQYPPQNDYEIVVLKRAATEMVLLQRCEEHLRNVYDLQSQAAVAEGWEKLRTAEAERVIAKISRDPGKVVSQLELSLQGCDLLIARWAGLGLILDRNGEWNGVERSLALDLLRVPPSLRSSGATQVDPLPGEEKPAVARLKAIVEQELSRLRAWVRSERLNDLDTLERRQVIHMGKFLLTEDARLLERYRAEHSRRYQAAIKELRHCAWLRDRGESDPGSVLTEYVEKARKAAASSAEATPPPKPAQSASESAKAAVNEQPASCNGIADNPPQAKPDVYAQARKFCEQRDKEMEDKRKAKRKQEKDARRRNRR